jgi:hypothetical protein
MGAERLPRERLRPSGVTGEVPSDSPAGIHFSGNAVLQSFTGNAHVDSRSSMYFWFSLMTDGGFYISP